MKKFKRFPLRDLVVIKGGKRLPLGREFSLQKTSHPYIRARDIGNGHIRIHEPVYLSDDMAQKLTRYRVGKGDVCVTIVGANVGEMGVVPTELDGANLTENAVRITSNGKIAQAFLKYALLAENALAQMKVLAGGSAQPKLGIYKIETIEIPLPPIPTQEKIAEILSAYDDLSENTTRRIQILEQMAQALYREWFVYFRFPHHEKVKLTAFPLGKIPQGWEVIGLSTLADFVRGVEPGSQNYLESPSDDTVPFLRVGDLGARSSGIYISRALANGKFLQKEDIAITLDGTVGIVKMGMEGCYSTGIRKVAIRDERLAWSFAYCLLKSDHIQDIIRAHAKGATILHAGAAVDEMKFALPPMPIMKAFDDFASPILKQILNLQDKNANLRRTRDLLLPKLISGEVDVSTHESKMEGTK